MKDFKLEDLFPYLQGHETEVRLGAMIALAVFVLVLVIYLVRVALRGSPETSPKTAPARPQATRITPEPVEEPAPIAEPAAAAIEESAPAVIQTTLVQEPEEDATRPIAALQLATIAPLLVPSAPPVTAPQLPQESVLRRHFVTHLRTILETIHTPHPTESVLRRHREQLISSQVDECLQDQAKLQRLFERYDEHRKKAVAAQLAG